VISTTALVRHAPVLNGELDGSLQMLEGEDVTLTSQGYVVGDLLVPGTPSVRINGKPTFAGIQDAAGEEAVPGATEPSVYNLQSLVINASSQLQIVGPVTLVIANGTAINLDSTVGNPAHPEWLTVKIAAGGIFLNASSTLHGYVIAPAGLVVMKREQYAQW
jgi:hypothetical protein